MIATHAEVSDELMDHLSAVRPGLCQVMLDSSWAATGPEHRIPSDCRISPFFLSSEVRWTGWRAHRGCEEVSLFEFMR